MDSFLLGRCSMAWSEHEKAMLRYKWTIWLRAHVYHGWYGIDGLEKRWTSTLVWWTWPQVTDARDTSTWPWKEAFGGSSEAMRSMQLVE